MAYQSFYPAPLPPVPDIELNETLVEKLVDANRKIAVPLCNRLIRETPAVLMEGVRGHEKNPGEFRYSQNWIGGEGGDPHKKCSIHST